MICWENRGIVPINLCEIHAGQVSLSGLNGKEVVPTMPQWAPGKNATEQPKSSVPNGRPADPQNGLETEHSVVTAAPTTQLTSGDAVKVLPAEAIANTPREDFEAYGTVFERANSSVATEETFGSADQTRTCSSNVEQCTFEATVHCPKCGKWFCDAHAEDEQWHSCVAAISGNGNLKS